MPLNWTALTSEQLAMEASLHNDDHNDGSMAFFDPDLATWSLVSLNPETLNIFKSMDEAASWINDEINFLKADGVMGRAKSYEDMIANGVQDPIIVGKRTNNMALWDGFHRVAISMVRKESVLTILGEYNV
jgi:hypothetical protein